MASNITTDDFNTVLAEMAKQLGISNAEYIQSLGYENKEEVAAKVAGVQSQIDAIIEMDDVDGVESLAEKIKIINGVLSEDGAIQDIVTKLNENKAAIEAEVAARTAAVSDVDAKANQAISGNVSNSNAIEALTSKVAGNKEASESAFNLLGARVTVNEGQLATLLGESDVAGSVKNLIAEEKARAFAAEASNRSISDANISTAKGEAIDSAKAYTDGIIEQVTTATNKQISDKTTEVTNDFNAKLETLSTDVKAQEEALLEAAKDYTTVNTDALQKQIDEVTGGSDNSVSSLNEKVTTIENRLDDTTDEDGNLVKGTDSKILDNVNAIKTLDDKRVVELNQAVEDLKSYSDSKTVVVSEVDVCSIKNAFRKALGLPETECDGSSDGSVV